MAKKVEDTIAAITGDTETPIPEPQEPNPREPENQVIGFPMPEGFAPPAGAKEGEEFTALASLKVGVNGDLQLTKIDGIPVNGGSDEEEESAEQEGEQNPPGATGAEGAIPSGGGSAVASARGIMGGMGIPA